MALITRIAEKRQYRRHDEEIIESLCSLSSRPSSPKSEMEQEKKIRREIANSNERRRMQSINSGFQSLRTLLPHHDGEKLSKAAILQQTSEYIYQLEQEKTRLLSQNCNLKRLLHQHNVDSDSCGSSVDSPLPKRKKTEHESSDEGIGSMSPDIDSEHTADELKREMVELRIQLDRERRLRLMLEDTNRALEAKIYPDHLRELAQVHLQYGAQGEVIIESDDCALESSRIGDLGAEEEVEEECIISCDDQPLCLSPNRGDVEAHQPSTVAVSASTNGDTTTTTILLPAGYILTRDAAGRTMATPVDASRVQAAEGPNCDRAQDLTMDVVEKKYTPSNPDEAKLYVSTSRQNLETIVEAIRHLEGDHLFQEQDQPVAQEIEVVDYPMADDMVVKAYAVHRQQQAAAVQQQNQRQRAVIQSVIPNRPAVIVTTKT